MAISVLGKLIASKNGIQVFRRVAQNGEVITTSLKNGDLYKTIVQRTVAGKGAGTLLDNGFIKYFKGKETLVFDHTKGIHTKIRNLRVNRQSALNEAFGFNINLIGGTSERNEFAVQRFKHVDGQAVRVGESYERIDNGTSVKELRRVWDNDALLRAESTRTVNGHFRESSITVVNPNMPVGQRITNTYSVENLAQPRNFAGDAGQQLELEFLA